MNLYESLLAKALNGGGGGNPNTIQVINATLENPWGSIELAKQYQTAYKSGGASAILEFDATALGFGVLSNPIDDSSFQGCYCSTDGGGEPDGNSLGFEVRFATGGSVGNAMKAFLVQNGTVTDMLPYASMIPTKLTIYWHPMR